MISPQPSRGNLTTSVRDKRCHKRIQSSWRSYRNQGYQGTMIRILFTWWAALLLSGIAVSHAEPVTLDGTEQWNMTSAQGREYRIMISLPEGDEPSTGGYPVIYVLDGNAYFPAFHAAKRAQTRLRGAIVVAIGYPSTTPLDFVRRAFDMSPPAPQDRNTPPQGGQDLFLDFIETRLMPKVSREFKVDQDQRSLVGHSFGGMLGVYAFFTRPALFQHVVAVSPSLWWQDKYLLQPERAFFRRALAGEVDLTRLSLTLLMGERDSVPMIQDASALHTRLQGLSQLGLRSGFLVEPGEDHASVPFRIPHRVLEELMGSRRF
ncbi:alpha/beta hydrolase-fold protein [Pseudomonas syringae USA007]|uniref:Alpha/beta hydrolase-fold protein n=1 Tax=Pseudomonas syringae USA007 TaxID=1357288 RepID=A0AAU8M4H6_PSESX|nr:MULTISPECIES: alpha/beta hydrolase-fold protein [Pseudomonas syringae group]